jgi:hypothetical protein
MILFIDDKPSPGMKLNAKPFEGARCEKRLLEWLATINIKPYYIFNTTDEYCMNMALMFLFCKCPIVALGNNASGYLKSYKKLNILHFKLPHPSGRNRQINDKEFIVKRLAECKNWIEVEYGK